jgi:lipopolysaccharide/colanic/teichoic acid biosynthesis glycosyltransferase
MERAWAWMRPSESAHPPTTATATAGAPSGAPYWPATRSQRPSSRIVASRAVVRAFDIVFALAVLTATAPVVLVAMIAIRLDSRGPALFRQRRMGLHGEEFELLKLRGMYIDAREAHPELFDYAGVTKSDSFYFHRPADPRVTRVGRILRRYSIDELPNFWNVLRGDMSVVGPRPEIPELAHLYGNNLQRLLSLRPGVTSPSKAYGRDALSFDETLALDLQWIETRSLAEDLQTIASTLKSVLGGTDVR